MAGDDQTGRAAQAAGAGRDYLAGNQAARQIVGAISVTMLFALVNQYAPAPTSSAPGAAKRSADPFRVFLGGFAAMAILVGLTETGEATTELATGLAYATMATAVLVYGGPVWKLLSTKLGASSTTRPTASTTPTAPLGGTAPTAATAPIG